MTISSVIVVVIAILLKWCLTYSAHRYQLIETTHIDINVRANSLLNDYYRLSIWQDSIPSNVFRITSPIVPEKHTYFQTAQTELARVLWPREENKLRTAYRKIEIAEDIRHTIYNEITDLMKSGEKRSRIRETTHLRKIREQISAFQYYTERLLSESCGINVKEYHGPVNSYKDKNPKEWKSAGYEIALSEGIGSHIFMPKLPVYSIFTFTPLIFSGIIISSILFPEFLEPLRCIFLTMEQLPERNEGQSGSQQLFYLFTDSGSTEEKLIESASNRAILFLSSTLAFINIFMFFCVCIWSPNKFFSQKPPPQLTVRNIASGATEETLTIQ